MGCDIHIYVEVRGENCWHHATGDFSEGSAPFDWRYYGMYGFLAGVRNYSAITPICEPKGMPADLSPEVAGELEGWELDAHTCSWLTLEELLAVDYDALVEDRRVTVQTGPNSWNGGATAEVGGGETKPLCEFLGPDFMSDLVSLQEIGSPEDVRIVFWFDN